jgi:hypothetical protein
VKRTVVFYKCERCGHEWLPRTEGTPPPKVCPNPACKSPYWDVPRRAPAKAAASKKGAPK